VVNTGSGQARMEPARASAVKADTTITSSLNATPQKAASAACTCSHLNRNLKTYFDFLTPYIKKCEKQMI